ncbi:MAG: ribosomal protection-like ABC-F family protein [Bacilli bacterium]
MISIKNINKSFPSKIIYNDASVNIFQQEKVGLIGKNGIGKSTLFDMIMDIDVFDGKIEISKNKKIGYYTQDLKLDEILTVDEILYKQFEHLFALEAKLLELSIDFVNNQDEYEKTFNEFENQGGYFITSNINEMISLFHLEPILSQTVDTLSGGQRGRVALAKLLLSKPDILLLDEPLNHLDLNAIEWLEKFLVKNVESFIVISHDRLFLDNVCNTIIEVTNNKLYKYKGNYSKYLENSQHNALTRFNMYDKQQVEIKKIKEQIKQYRIWGNSRDSEKMFKKAKELEKRLAKIDEIPKPLLDRDMRLEFKYLHTRTRNIFWANDLMIGYEKKLTDKVNFEIYNGDRIALVGANGCGKSTLLKVLSGKLSALSGNIYCCNSIKIGYFDQVFENLDKSNSIIEEVHKDNILLSNYELRSHLAKFLFKNDDLNKSIATLSGGECVRVSLAKLSLQESNVLILDEPTNHLDIDSKQIVELALSNYKGTIIFSSHDRYLINKLATKIYEFSKNKINIIDKTYSEYIFERDMVFDKEEKKSNNDYAYQKDQKSKKTKQKKIENRINSIESEIKLNKTFLFENDICSSKEEYDKIVALNQKNQEVLEQLIEEYMLISDEID